MTDVADLVMPKLGLTMTEGRIARWAVVPGGRFAAGDVVVEIETDKIVNEVEAPTAGTLLELLEPEGATTPVGAPIARWRLDLSEAVEGSEPPRDRHAKAEAAQVLHATRLESVAAASPRVATDQPAATGRVYATPYARKLAKEAGLNIGAVQGTGPRGRIKAADVERAKRRPPPSAVATRPVDALRSTAAAVGAPARELSFATAPVYVRRLREIERDLSRSLPDLMLERRHYVALACLRTMSDQRAEDATLAIGFEVDTPEGPRSLAFPARARTTLSALAAQHADLESRARQGRLRPEDMCGGRVLILAGNEATSVFGPAVPPGWSLSVGIGAVRDVFRPGPDGAPLLAHEMSLALSYAASDLTHASALELLEGIKALLEEPLAMLVL